MQVIPDATAWQDMRKACNHIVHEYPDQPELRAIYLNQIIAFVPQILNVCDVLKLKVADSQK